MTTLPLVASSNFTDPAMTMRRGWMRTLRSFRDRPVRSDNPGGFVSQTAAKFMMFATYGACIDVTLKSPGLKTVTLRLPTRPDIHIDHHEMAEICDVALKALQACCDPVPAALHHAVIARSDAICASLALNAGIAPNDVKICPPTPFETAKVVMHRRGVEEASFTLSPTHQAWFLAQHCHVEFSHDPSDGDVLRLGQRVTHMGPSASDPVALMRLLANLPAGPAIEVPEGAWQLKWGNPPF